MNDDVVQLEKVLAEKSTVEMFVGARINEQLNYALMEAVTHQSGYMVSILLSAGAEPSSFSQPLIITAVDFNAPSVVYALIDHGFDVNAKGTHGTALHSAMRVGNLELADALLQAGADLNAVDDSLTTPLHLAVQTKNCSCVEWLLSNGCDVNRVDITWGRTPLHWAALFTSTSILTNLIESGANQMAMDKNGCAPWTLAVTNKNIETLRVLFCEQSVNVGDLKGKTPLHWACRSGFTSGMEFLVQKGSNINAKDKEGITPLMDALAMRQTKVAAHLLRHHELEVNMRDLKGKTALHWSCRTGIVYCTRLLLDKGADCNAKDFSNVTPFQEAVAIRHSDVAEALIRWDDFDIHLRDWKGRTPLHWASRTGLFSCVRLLLKLGADANAQNQSGRTPLMDAVASGELEVAGRLLEHQHTRVNQVDHSGQSALHLLLADGPYRISMSMLERLAKGGADLNQPVPFTGRPPLIYYIKHWPQVAQALLAVGANPNLVTDRGDTALLQAVESGSIETVKLFLRANPDLSISGIKGPDGVSPVIEACSDEDTNIYKLLVRSGCSLIGVGQFLDDVVDTRANPDIDKELSWLERRLRNPLTLFEISRAVVNKTIGYKNYIKKLEALMLPKRLKEFLALDGFLLWKERQDRIQYGE